MPSESAPAATDSRFPASPWSLELPSDQRTRLLIFTLLLGLFVVALLRTAWVCDDAYIAFRTVDNLVHGFGLRWNVDERVQAFTSPLWVFVVSAGYVVTHEPYYTSLAISIALALITFWLVGLRIAASTTLMVVALTALLFSRAFVDFSTSGLENPLTHLLLALFLLAYWNAERGGPPFALILVAALLAMTRPDAVLLTLPPLAVIARRLRSRRALLLTALALAPLIAWECFSLIYFGFPFPNTAYAKLGSGESPVRLIYHGIDYFIDSAAFDPVTLLVIVLTLVEQLFDDCREWAPVFGLALYGVYLLVIGGDFMSGRFLTAPLLWAVLLLIHRPRPRIESVWPVVVALLLVAGFAAPHPALSSQFRPEANDPSSVRPGGVSDEWAFYYPSMGLLNRHGRRSDDLPWVPAGFASVREQGPVVVFPNIGYFGYLAGPGIHIVDPYGLADPLLARLPAHEAFRVGHFDRTVPDGYIETLRTGRNHIADPAIHAFYDELALITRGPIWSRARLRAIVMMNLGRYDSMLRGVKN
jgi:arabinofuranosyltransferase